MDSKVRVLFSQLFIKIFSRAKYISDEKYNLILYRLRTGLCADIRNPKSFNENILARKVFDNEYDLAVYTDKFEVRNYVSKVIGNKYLVHNFGIWEKPEDIEFDNLPQKFVLKATHGSGWNVLVKDKDSMDIQESCNKLNRMLNKNYYYMSREKNYKNILPRVVCEEYLEARDKRGLVDFKVFCFGGISKFFSVSYEQAGQTFYNLFYANGNKISINSKYNEIEGDEICQIKDEVLQLAEKLAKRFDFVRVDFYIVDGHIYFSELTFHSGGGIRPIEPREIDLELGTFFTNGGNEL